MALLLACVACGTEVSVGPIVVLEAPTVTATPAPEPKRFDCYTTCHDFVCTRLCVEIP